ncbi:MAG: aldehyde dehydrogenase family protein [Saprospiraceae bacterium]|nr:aldehyde dehydrogenase family protein [Saprospiraceae bacterium]
MYRSINPYNQILNASYESTPKKEFADIIQQSSNVFKNFWRNLTVADRVDSLKNLPELMKAKREDLAFMITSEMGKPISQSRAEIDKSILLCEYYLTEAEGILQPQTRNFPDKIFEVHYEPLGVILGIMPWNFPIWQAFRFAIPTLLAGNTILLKPASSVPLSGKKMEELIGESLQKEFVFTCILPEQDHIESIIAHPLVRGVSITGSTRAGAAVAERAGKYLKKCVLELGGSDPFIVWHDADLDKAASRAVESRMNNNGQTCNAAKRWLIHERVYDDFLNLIKEKIQALKIGDPLDEEVSISTISSELIYKEVHQQIKKAINQGAEIWTVDGDPTAKWQILPGILTNVSNTSAIANEELFGPVAQLYSFSDEDEMIRIANQTDFGLGCSIWTADLEKARKWSGQLDCGYISINQMLSSDPRVPFGGVKNSGVGRELGPEGLLEFVNVQTIQLP